MTEYERKQCHNSSITSKPIEGPSELQVVPLYHFRLETMKNCSQIPEGGWLYDITDAFFSSHGVLTCFVVKMNRIMKVDV